jgi:hypothetical protein
MRVPEPKELIIWVIWTQSGKQQNSFSDFQKLRDWGHVLQDENSRLRYYYSA